MAIKRPFDEIEQIVKRTTDNLLKITQSTGRPGANMRLAIGDLRARLAVYMADGTFGRRLLACFRLATDAGMTAEWVDAILRQLTAEKPTQLAAVMVVQSATLFALAQAGRIIAATSYRSSDDVEATLRRAKDWFDIARDAAAGQSDDASYRALNELAGSMTRYLADVARPLPRMLRYDVAAMPAFALSHYIYGDGSRSEEIIAENRIVHPAFCMRTVKALSA